MRHQVVINMQQIYPFGEFQHPEKENRQILVRKRIQTGNKNFMISRLKFSKNLKIPNTIQIKSILQDQKYIQIYYQYIPLKFQTWMRNMSDELQNNLIKQLFLLASFLAQKKIIIQFNYNFIGLNSDFHIKYFLDFTNAILNQQMNTQMLKQKYYQQIMTILKKINNKNQNIYSLQQTKNIQIFQQQKKLKSLKILPLKTASLKVLQYENNLIKQQKSLLTTSPSEQSTSIIKNNQFNKYKQNNYQNQIVQLFQNESSKQINHYKSQTIIGIGNNKNFNEKQQNMKHLYDNNNIKNIKIPIQNINKLNKAIQITQSFKKNKLPQLKLQKNLSHSQQIYENPIPLNILRKSYQISANNYNYQQIFIDHIPKLSHKQKQNLTKSVNHNKQKQQTKLTKQLQYRKSFQNYSKAFMMMLESYIQHKQQFQIIQSKIKQDKNIKECLKNSKNNQCSRIKQDKVQSTLLLNSRKQIYSKSNSSYLFKNQLSNAMELKIRVQNVIQNSKKLIEKFKSPTKKA